MVALRASSYKITAETAGPRLSQLQTYQLVTQSAIVGSFQKTKKRHIDFSDKPLIKRLKRGHLLLNSTVEYMDDLNFLRVSGETIHLFGIKHLLPELNKIDPDVSCDVAFLDAVITP